MSDAVFMLTYSPVTWWIAYAIALAIAVHYLAEDDEPRTSEKAARPVDPSTYTDDREVSS